MSEQTKVETIRDRVIVTEILDRKAATIDSELDILK